MQAETKFSKAREPQRNTAVAASSNNQNNPYINNRDDDPKDSHILLITYLAN